MCKTLYQLPISLPQPATFTPKIQYRYKTSHKSRKPVGVANRRHRKFQTLSTFAQKGTARTVVQAECGVRSERKL